MSKEKSEISFVADRTGVTMKVSARERKMSSKDVISEIDRIRAEIERGEQQLRTMEENSKTITANIADVKKELAKLEAFEDRMRALQESRCKAIYEELKDSAIKEVEDSYKEDPALDDKQNALQEFQQLQRKIATSKQVAEEIAPKVMQKMFFKEPFFENPFVKKAE